MENRISDKDSNEVEQLKRKIMQMKMEIARKQKKLLKSERAARNRSKMKNVQCGDDKVKSLEILHQKEVEGRMSKMKQKEINVQSMMPVNAIDQIGGLQMTFLKNEKIIADYERVDSVNVEVKQSENGSRSPVIISSKNFMDRERIELNSSLMGKHSLRNRNSEELTEVLKKGSICIAEEQSSCTEKHFSSSKQTTGSRDIENLPLRRSKRIISQETHLIRSEDSFIIRRVTEERKEDSKKSVLMTSNGPRIFPAVPKPSVGYWNVLTDFVLPDSQYASLKLKVRKTKELLCFRENANILDNTCSAGTDSPNAFPLLPSNEFDRKLTVNYRLICSEREPVLAVYCSYLRGSYDRIGICVVVQIGTITTWTCESNDWVLLKKCRLDLRDCQKSNVHRLETKFVVGTVCINRNTLWIHACDSDKRVTLKKFDLRADRKVDQLNVLSCTVGIDALFVGYFDSERTTVKKYILSPNLKDIVRETNLKEVADRLNSLVCVGGLEEALLGTSCSKLYIWNINRKLIKVIEPKGEKFNCQTCMSCVAQNGLLFLGMISSVPRDYFWIVAVNPATSAWTKITCLATGDDIVPKQCRTDRDYNKIREIRHQMQFLLTFRTAATIWHLGTRKLLAFVNGLTVDSMAIYQRNVGSDTEIIVASNTGHVASYSISSG